MFASLISTIYPPPDLLSSCGQGVPVRSLKTGEQSKVAEAAKATETAEVARVPEVAEATEPAKPAEPAVRREETTAQQTEASST